MSAGYKPEDRDFTADAFAEEWAEMQPASSAPNASIALERIACRQTDASMDDLFSIVRKALQQPAPAAQEPLTPLTDEQVAEACGWMAGMGCKPLPRELRIARAIEAAHGITGAAKLKEKQ